MDIMSILLIGDSGLSYGLTTPLLDRDLTTGLDGGGLNPTGKSRSNGGAGIFAIWNAACTLKCQGNISAVPLNPLLLLLLPEDDLESPLPPPPRNQEPFDLGGSGCVTSTTLAESEVAVWNGPSET